MPLQTTPPVRTVSFSGELLNGFGTACQIGDDGARLVKDVVAFFKKRQEIELAYAKSLNKLAGQYLSQIPEEKRVLHDRSAASPAAQSSILTSWFNVLEEALFTAGSHEQLAAGMASQVSDPLAAAGKEVETRRKQHMTEGVKQQKHLQDAYTELKKAQGQHAAQQKEVDDCQEALERAKGNYMTKDSTFQKLTGRLRAAEEKAAQAAQALHEQEQKCTKIQLDHYKVHFPHVLEEMEQREEERAAATREALLTAVILQRDTLQRELGLNVALCTFVSEADTRVDIEDAIREFDGDDDMDAPVTSILNPALKAHLSATALEAPKPFRDYLFILVAHNRRLYQYESDNAQHPKFVTTLPLGNRTVRPVDPSLFGRKHVFQVITRSRTLYIECPDQKTYRTWMAGLRDVCFPDSGSDADMRLVRSVSVKVVEAKDLPKSGDYFALVLLDHERQALTTTQAGTTTPYWNQSFVIDDIPIQAKEVVVEVQRSSGNFGTVARQSAAVLKRKVVSIGRTDTPRKPRSEAESKAKERLREGDVAGRVVFRIAEQTEGAGREHWAPLTNADGEAGSIRVAVQTTDECIRPEHDYLYLKDLIRADNPDLQSVLRALDQSIQGSDRVQMAKVLMSVAHANGCLLDVLLTLCRAEVQGSTDANTLFRGNSLATKALDEFMKLVTIYQGRYLQQTLAMPIQTIYDSRASCEMDPTRISASDVAKERSGNFKRLLNAVNLVWSSVEHSIASVPPELRFLFHHLYAMVKEQFPGTPSAPRTAVVGFFFLRLICPAIMGPQLFGLQSHHPEDNTARTLILISKVLQNLANGVTFGHKEEYMKDLNPFISDSEQAMQGCLQRITAAPTTPVVAEVELQASPRCLAAFHRLLEANLDGLQQMADSEASTPGDRERLQRLMQVVTALRRPSSEEHRQALQAEIERQERLVRSRESGGSRPTSTGPATPQQQDFIRASKKGGLSTLLRRTKGRTSSDNSSSQPSRIRSVASSPHVPVSTKTSTSSSVQSQQPHSHMSLQTRLQSSHQQQQQQYRGTSPSSMEVELALSDSTNPAAAVFSQHEAIPEFLAEEAPRAHPESARGSLYELSDEVDGDVDDTATHAASAVFQVPPPPPPPPDDADDGEETAGARAPQPQRTPEEGAIGLSQRQQQEQQAQEQQGRQQFDDQEEEGEEEGEEEEEEESATWRQASLIARLAGGGDDDDDADDDDDEYEPSETNL